MQGAMPLKFDRRLETVLSWLFPRREEGRERERAMIGSSLLLIAVQEARQGQGVADVVRTGGALFL